MYGYMDLTPIRDGSNCRSCRMRRSDCEFADLGEEDVRCCEDCNHPREVDRASHENPVASPAVRPNRPSDQECDRAAVRLDSDVRPLWATRGQVAFVKHDRASVLRGEGDRNG